MAAIKPSDSMKQHGDVTAVADLDCIGEKKPELPVLGESGCEGDEST